MAKEQKTNAMRLLEQQKIPHTVNQYDCPEFVDGVQVRSAFASCFSPIGELLLAFL